MLAIFCNMLIKRQTDALDQTVKIKYGKRRNGVQFPGYIIEQCIPFQPSIDPQQSETLELNQQECIVFK